MSRSKRPIEYPKCICGAHETPYKFYVHLQKRHGKTECAFQHYVHRANEMFLRYRTERSEPLFEEEDDVNE